MQNCNHAMIDLETLGQGYDAAFVSIGACLFNPDTGEIGSKYYRRVDWHDAIKAGSVDAATIKWWLDQSSEARKELLKPGIPLSIMLTELSAWLSKGVQVWGNGATFDIAILEHAYQGQEPWEYWQVRDVRTVVEMAKGIVSKDDVEREGVAHNALDDAVYQANYVSLMWQTLRGER